MDSSSANTEKMEPSNEDPQLVQLVENIISENEPNKEIEKMENEVHEENVVMEVEKHFVNESEIDQVMGVVNNEQTEKMEEKLEEKNEKQEEEQKPESQDVPEISQPMEAQPVISESVSNDEQVLEPPNADINQINGDISKTASVLSSSLALIADYGLTSDSESDSESESSSSSSSSSSDTESVKIINSGYRNTVTISSDDDSSDSENEEENRKKSSQDPAAKRIIRQKIKAKGELDICDLPPIEDLNISVPETVCVELGKIMSIVDQLVLVESYTGSLALDLETVLFLDQGNRPLGRIFDVLGQVHQPIYCVRFNSSEQINEKLIEVGQKVYYDHRQENTSVVVLPNLMRQKGSDASWEHDVEPPEGCLDYSDDEQERSIRKKKKGLDPNGRNKRSAPTQNQNFPQRVRNPYYNGNNNNQRHHHQQMQYHQQQNYNNHQDYSWHTYYQQQPPPPGPCYRNPYAQPGPVMNPMMYMQPPPPPPPYMHNHPQIKREQP